MAFSLLSKSKLEQDRVVTVLDDGTANYGGLFLLAANMLYLRLHLRGSLAWNLALALNLKQYILVLGDLLSYRQQPSDST